MLVVSDADVIIHLSKLNKLSILRSLYIEVAIPEYIKSEITGKDNPAIHEAINSFLKIFATSKDLAENIAVKHGIHIGEAHVKALGEELKATLFLSNERKVRKAATLLQPDRYSFILQILLCLSDRVFPVVKY